MENEKLKYINLDFKVNSSFFDKNSGNVSKRHDNYINVNLFINKILADTNEFLLNNKIKEKAFCYDDFKNFIYDKIKNNISPVIKDDFFDFAYNQFELKKPHVCNRTYKRYYSEINKLIKFKPDLTFDDINLNFIQSFENFLIENLKNDTNTRVKVLHLLY